MQMWNETSVVCRTWGLGMEELSVGCLTSWGMFRVGREVNAAQREEL